MPAPDTALTEVLESLPDGILVHRLSGEIDAFNRKLTAMWAAPEDLLRSRGRQPALRFILSRLKTPRAFVAILRRLATSPTIVTDDVLWFKGRPCLGVPLRASPGLQP